MIRVGGMFQGYPGVCWKTLLDSSNGFAPGRNGSATPDAKMRQRKRVETLAAGINPECRVFKHHQMLAPCMEDSLTCTINSSQVWVNITYIQRIWDHQATHKMPKSQRPSGQSHVLPKLSMGFMGLIEVSRDNWVYPRQCTHGIYCVL